jgi:hypothetical protein
VLPVREPPGADPHAGWCGEGGLNTHPYPIRRHGLSRFGHEKKKLSETEKVFSTLAKSSQVAGPSFDFLLAEVLPAWHERGDDFYEAAANRILIV